jgi:hypothetical protein
VEFISKRLEVALIPEYQKEIMHAVATHPRVAVRSSHKTGKSFCATALALWWASEKPNGRVVLTATTNPQIRNILWKELKRLSYGRGFPVPAELPGIGMQWPDGREIIGFSTKESERMAGISGSDLLFIVDEASGVTENIFEAIEGNRAGGAHILLIGNPTRPSGTFYDAFHSKTEFYKTFHVTGHDASEYDIPGLATSAWIDEKLAEWGEYSPMYQVRCMGNFASSHETTVVPLSLVSEAVEAYEHTPSPRVNQLSVGVDPARFGDDDACIVVRRGNKVLEIATASQLDNVELAGWVVDVVKRHQKGSDQPALCKIDAIGVGSGVVDTLIHSAPQELIKVVDVQCSQTANDDESYYNLRTQLWFGISEWLKDGGVIPEDDKLCADMVSANYDFDARGRYRVEKKSEIKRRLGRSPDRADALALAIYTPALRLAYVNDRNVRKPRMVGRGF